VWRYNRVSLYDDHSSISEVFCLEEDNMKHKWISVLVSLAIALSAWVVMPVGKAWAATLTWDGGGDGISWNDANNWVGNVAPTSADDVVLDNSVVPGTYTVNLPTGAVTISIHKLTITPAAGNTIALILPSGNTANPGFSVGDATAGTDDIILNSGAILRNSSGATVSSNGIEANTTTNGTVRINNGGRYIHNTSRSTGGIVPSLSTAAGTETGVFEYDSPGTGSVSISASGRNYGTLILTRSAGAAIYTSSGGSALTVRGNFIINGGVTYNSSMTGAMNVGKDFTNNGAALTLPTGQAVNLNGTTEQVISGSSAIAFSTLNVVSGAKVVLPTNTTAITLTNNGTITQTQTVNGSTNVAFVDIGGYGGVTINANNFDLGSTTVAIKGNQACNVGDELIHRCFNIIPTNTTGRNATITFSFTDSELNSRSCASMEVYHWNGTGWDGTPLTRDTSYGPTSDGRDCTSNPRSIRVIGVTDFSPFGLTSIGVPTAITLLEIKAAPSSSPIVWLVLVASLALLGGVLILHRRSRAA
jgi:hypothetical protein